MSPYLEAAGIFSAGVLTGLGVAGPVLYPVLAAALLYAMILYYWLRRVM